jgi:ABC-2 type transport system permease protein
MNRVLHAEWTKLRTEPSALWMIPSVVVTTVLASLIAAAAGCPRGRCEFDVTGLSLGGVKLGQALVVLLAVVVMGDERTATFTAMPRRLVVLSAKAVIVAGVTLVAGVIAVLGGLALTPAVLHGNEKPAAGSVLYLILIGLLSLGAAAALRDPAVSAASVLGVLYGVPLIAQMIQDVDLQRNLRRFAPMTGSHTVQAVWAAAALLIGGVVLWRRDP